MAQVFIRNKQFEARFKANKAFVNPEIASLLAKHSCFEARRSSPMEIAVAVSQKRQTVSRNIAKMKQNKVKDNKERLAVIIEII